MVPVPGPGTELLGVLVVFGGWDYADDVLEGDDWVARGYAGGVSISASAAANLKLPPVVCSKGRVVHDPVDGRGGPPSGRGRPRTSARTADFVVTTKLGRS